MLPPDVIAAAPGGADSHRVRMGRSARHAGRRDTPLPLSADGGRVVCALRHRYNSYEMRCS